MSQVSSSLNCVTSNYVESDLVVIDLADVNPLSQPPIEREVAQDNAGEYMKLNAKFGFVDPRPISMYALSDDIQNIYTDQGIIIVFAGSKSTPDGTDAGQASFTPSQDNYDYLNTWSFLPLFTRGIFTQFQKGKEIAPSDLIPKDSFIAKHLRDAEYICTLQRGPYIEEERWIDIAFNKRNLSVATLIIPKEGSKVGHIIILPQIKDKAKFLSEALTDWLPNLAPNIFPDAKELKWINEQKYQPKEILALEMDIKAIHTEAEEKVASLNEQVKKILAEYEYQKDLISGTDDRLVLAIKKSLEMLGFLDVIEMDEENRELLREDLQIRDTSPWILVEVKGIAGTGKENSMLQVNKYLAPRMKQLRRTDIRGLLILNHQKNLRPLDRQQTPFSEDVTITAHANEIGLLTTWNLFKLLRNFQKFGWHHSQIAELFYKNGVIESVPVHYEYLGDVEKYIEQIQVVGIRLKKGSISKGDRIAFEGEIEFEEQEIETLEFKNASIDTAPEGELVGTKTNFLKSELPIGTRVFLVKSTK